MCCCQNACWNGKACGKITLVRELDGAEELDSDARGVGEAEGEAEGEGAGAACSMASIEPEERVVACVGVGLAAEEA